MTPNRITTLIIFALGVSIVSGCGSKNAQAEPDGPSVATEAAASKAPSDKLYDFDDNGDLVRPTGYREWIYVGTPLTPNDLNNGKAAFPEFHSVYIEPGAWAVWKETGEFPDRTIIMKELIGVGSKAAVSGAGYFMGDYVGLEATIKDKSLFPDEPGNWAYYTFSTADHATLTPTAKLQKTEACNTCHLASAADDFVFTQYYPVLRAGKAAGRKATGGFDDVLGH